MFAIGVIVLIMLVGALGAGFFNHKMGMPEERHVPFALDQVPMSKRPQFVAKWAEVSSMEQVLRAVVQKHNLVVEFGVTDESAAIEELGKRTRVELKDDGLTMQTFASGTRRERDLLNQLCGSLFMAARDQYLVISGQSSGAPAQ